MNSQKKRYLFMGSLFIVIALLAAMPVFLGDSEKKNLFYVAICAFIAILFLKNAFKRQ